MKYLGPTPAVDEAIATKKYVDDNAGGGGAPWYFAPPLASIFTLAHSASIGDLSLTDDTDAGLIIKNPSLSAGGLMGAVATVAVPAATSWSATARLSGTALSGEYFGLGMVVMNSAGKLITHGVRRYTSVMGLMANQWNSLTSFGTDFIRWDGVTLAEMPWRRITYDTATSTLSFWAGTSGKDWILLDTNSAFLGAPDRVGLYMGGGGGSVNSTTKGVMVVDHWDTSF